MNHLFSSEYQQVAFVDLGQNAILNGKARLKSPQYKPATSASSECIRFWYMAYSSLQSNQLSLSVYQSTNDSNEKLLLTKQSSQRMEWKLAQYTLLASAQDYSIIFQGETSTNQNAAGSVIALDEMYITDGECGSVIDCDFKYFTICEWLQSKDDELDWLLNSGQTDSSDTGPHADRFDSTQGVYIYLESSMPAKKNDRAILISANIEPTESDACFGLYYFMHGRDVYQFNVYKTESMGGLKLLNRVEKEQGFGWHQLLLNITSQNVEYRLLLEGVVS